MLSSVPRTARPIDGLRVDPARATRRGGARLGPILLLALLAVALSGCGLFAAPCRVTSAGLKIVPLVGPVAAAPTDACANAIDPTSTRS